MKTTKQKLPKWFEGTIYEKGDTVVNPFSKEECKLNNLELSLYDFIVGCFMLTDLGMIAEENYNDMQKGLEWFESNNPEAYKILLD